MMEKKRSVGIIILGVLNILVGLYIMLLLLLMQGVFIFPVGLTYLIFGIGILIRKLYIKLLFYGIIPVTVLVAFNIIMMGICKDVPEYYKTPLLVGMIIMSPFLSVCVADFLVFTRPKVKEQFK